jgi:hypothetical protein
VVIAKDSAVSFVKDRIVDELIGKLEHLVGPSGPFGKKKGANREEPKWSTGPSGFAALQAGFEAGPAAELYDKRRWSVHKVYVVGAAVVAAAALAASGSAALFVGWPRGGGDNPPERRGVLERKSAVASDATTRPTSPSSAADTEPPPLPATDPVATPGTPARAQVPGSQFSTSSDSAQVPSGSSPPSGEPEPPAPVAPAPSAPPTTAPSTKAPPGSSGLHEHPGRAAH